MLIEHEKVIYRRIFYFNSISIEDLTNKVGQMDLDIKAQPAENKDD